MSIAKIFFILILIASSAFSISAQNNTTDCPAPHYGLMATFYREERRDLEKYEYKFLDNLTDTLEECPNYVGYISYYTKKGTKQKKTLDYVNKIKEYLIKEKNISPERLVFDDNGISKISYIDIFVMTKDTIPHWIPRDKNKIEKSPIETVKKRFITRAEKLKETR